ncbi:hypothetical protein QBC47DRAFT_347920 [Echria macrotheca]|uniref:FAD dependent oxidoreductase domain-containing protein n=1 Tax=Echria macrotheca TaxID=438768 RepID=A0AAJ0B9N7_9PEZI|nr:hypothetical protein QBC47DRAFT_347920 [Echria macrotheca]
MTKVTIFGAGITGMAIATQLPRDCDVTIVARDLPGDSPSQDWASPWACAGWVALGGSPLEEKMQLDALAYLTRLAVSHPDSGVVLSHLTDLHDNGTERAEDLWSFGRLPGLTAIPEPASLGTKLAVRYPSVVVNPSVFLPWLHARLEQTGVRFERIGTVTALAELDRFGHDVLVNASGLASLTLADVRDEHVVVDRTYTVLVKSEYKESFVRRGGGQYTYIFGRGDGTAVVGGISLPVDHPVLASDEIRKDLIQRAHDNLSDDFPSADPKDYEILEDLAGLRPLRLPNVRIEKDLVRGNIVHAYGTTIGGYMSSFGLGREVARMVGEFAFE